MNHFTNEAIREVSKSSIQQERFRNEVVGVSNPTSWVRLDKCAGTGVFDLLGAIHERLKPSEPTAADPVVELGSPELVEVPEIDIDLQTDTDLGFFAARTEHILSMSAELGGDLVAIAELHKSEGGPEVDNVLVIPNRGNVREATIEWVLKTCLLYTSPSPRDATLSRMPSSA